MRLVIELKRDAIPMVVLNKLYKHTQMQTTFGVINIALVGGVPRTLTLPEMLKAYIAFQKEVIVRRTKFELDKAETRAHILEGLLVALDNLDQIISIIRKAADVDDGRDALIDTFELTRPQAQAILDLRLQKLTSLERHKVKEEHDGLMVRIKELRELLGDESPFRRHQDRAAEIKRLYNDDRRTEIVPDEGDFDIEDMIAEQQMVITITKTGYVKRLALATYRQQKRGGMGVAGMELKEEDEVEHLFITSTHNFLLFFTSVGKVYRLKVHELPEAGRNARGKHIVNLLPLRQDEKICAVINTRNFDPPEGKHLIFGTRKGIVKKTLFASYNTPRKSDGIIAIDIREDDELMAVRHTSGDDDILMVSRLGQAVRFHEDNVRPRAATPAASRHAPAQGRRGHQHGDRARRRRPLRGHRERLRQAHAHRRVPRQGPRRPGRAHDRAHRPQGLPRRRRWCATTTRSCSRAATASSSACAPTASAATDAPPGRRS